MFQTITVNKIRTFSFWHPENRESNSERKLAKIRTIWLWLFAGPGGRASCSPNLLDSSDFWDVEIWNWKYCMREDPRAILEYFKQILLWTSTKCHINYTYTWYSRYSDIYILQSRVFMTRATELLTLLALDWYLRAFLVSWVAVCT